MRYFTELAYCGTKYHGWQIQPNAKSVQGTIEEVLSTLFRQSTSIVGAGRTDTGVHASYYVAHFDSAKNIDTKQLKFKMNCMLPSDISIYNILEVNHSAHARFDAISRTYNYFINNIKHPFGRDLFWDFRQDLDIELMNEACALLLGEKDFTSFSKLHTDVNNNICDLKFAEWGKTTHGYKFEIKANRFLRNMVRAIVGTLVEIGLGKIEPTEVAEILNKKNRKFAGTSVPAQGLFLSNIEYPQKYKMPANKY
ncbi:MAG: tRNA pseudouridine(38-40) synthase TruA [Bacteroidales bacterium]